ncbi:hypothetical protein SAMN04489712_116101 [Thermomonospora echinospora]|uniref:EthD domain-containing protein n=1 Tax=Thermomonospora echinospora TaxID=1992 RepID=A0A1H6DEW4_9ACTN|nr:EthD domain-containing protein [Thermomonospora echinospora]SEG83918.1 hypothetical protein SAMN04489712_116101 [Thermomonospora echinospora]
MIRRIRFATRRDDVPPGAFADAWPGAVAAAAQAPPGVRPVRLAACTTLPEFTSPEPRHDGIGIEWFTSAGHLRRFLTWLGTSEGRAVPDSFGRVAAPGTSPVVVGTEAVLRGAEWLDARWRDGGVKLKHMAIAVRAAGLTPAEFSERWRGHAGRVRRSGGGEAVPIPAEARGLAYVQSHPCPRTAGEWAYDALNEVYFEDPGGLRTRVEWFRENVRDGADGDLFGRSWFLAAREQVVPVP